MLDDQRERTARLELAPASRDVGRTTDFDVFLAETFAGDEVETGVFQADSSSGSGDG